MLPVYSSYFGLTDAPFNITPDPSFLFASTSHQEGLAQLRYGIEARRGFIVLTGEVGTGKTTLIQTLLRQLGHDTTTALIFSVITSPVDLLRYVCEEFKIAEPSHNVIGTHDYISLLNEFLLKEYRRRHNVALIIDEAQNLSSEVLESVRLLSNFETTKDKLLQILLVGQPELNDRLNTQELRQLRQRITLRHQLRPLTLSECQQYIIGRLRCAGAASAIFLPETVEAIHRYAGGIPRLINIICDNAMISAYALEKKDVDVQTVREVAEDLCIVSGSPNAEDFGSRKSRRIESTKSTLVQPAVAELDNSRKSEPQSRAVALPVVPRQFIFCLRDALIDVIGPMGQVILAEQIKCFGASEERFPREKIESLIDSLSNEIADSSSRARFRRGIFEGSKVLQ